MPHPLKSSRALRQRFDLYLSADEVEHIRASANTARLPMSTFVRRVALRQRIDPAPATADLARWRELAPLANNLNQLARACNAGTVTAEIYPTLTALAEQVRLLRLELIGTTGNMQQASP